jgi:hypothetical protein
MITNADAAIKQAMMECDVPPNQRGRLVPPAAGLI